MNKNEAYWIAAQTGLTPLAIGMPGVAKTQLNYAFARAVQRPMYTLIGSLRDPGDIGGYPNVHKIQTKSNGELVYMALVPPKYAVDCFDGRDWIIFIDELTTCPPAVQAALLRVIAEKVVGDIHLPRNTWILSAANPPDQAAAGMELEAPMSNRLVHLQWQIDWESWEEGMMNRLSFPVPKFPLLPATWMDKFPEVSGMVVAFRNHRPTMFADFPNDRSKQGGPWPSPRSWTHAAQCMAAARSVNASKGVELDLVTGCVGESVAAEFYNWLESLDLPDPESLIIAARKELEGKGKMKYAHPDRPDKVIAMLSAVNSRVIDNLTAERWEAGMLVLEKAAEHSPDVAVACAKPIATRQPAGAKITPAFVRNMFPILRKTLLDKN